MGLPHFQFTEGTKVFYVLDFSTMPPVGHRDFLLTLYWQKHPSFSRISEAFVVSIKIMGNEANSILTY
jgi:hypothetical protein